MAARYRHHRLKLDRCIQNQQVGGRCLSYWGERHAVSPVPTTAEVDEILVRERSSDSEKGHAEESEECGGSTEGQFDRPFGVAFV